MWSDGVLILHGVHVKIGLLRVWRCALVEHCLPSAVGPCMCCLRFLCRLEDKTVIATGCSLNFASQRVVPC